MTHLFDGMTGIASSILGAPVGYTPAGGALRTVQAMFRRVPVRAMGPDGTEVLLVNPTLRVGRDLVPEIRRGDLITADGADWHVLNVWPQGSPAADAHLICELDGPV